MTSPLARIFAVSCLLAAVTDFSNAARILGIIPLPSYSHQIVPRALWRALVQRGHQVVTLTTDPIRDPTLKNLTEIDLSYLYAKMREIDLTGKQFTNNWLDMKGHLCHASFNFTRFIYEHPEVRKMYAKGSKEKFDVVIAEILFTPAIYALAHKFNAPLIGTSSLPMMTHNQYLLGAPILPSHPSSWELEERVDFGLTFWQRLRNFVTLYSDIGRMLECYAENQRIAETYLGPNIPNVVDLERQISLVFVSQENAISVVKPTLPNEVSVSGIHIPSKIPPLPKDIQNFIENATNGFIYVSLGTNMMVKSLPENMRKAFREVFSALPCKVLWKTDDRTLGENLDNIYTSAWLPQISVLAQPNIRLFVYQGGLQSTEEALHHAVPLVGIPMIADQFRQVKKLVSLGVARLVDVRSFTKESLSSNILDVLNNKTYKHNAIKLRDLIKDKPYDTLEMAAWWVEFVIRHKGAKHLQNSIAFDPWYQRYDMDIVAFISIAVFVIGSSLLVIIYKALSFLLRNSVASTFKAKSKLN